MITTCKQCWNPIKRELYMNHYSWCSKECRNKWIRSHQLKGAKNRAKKAYESELMSWGLGSSACDMSSQGNL